jgi:predicted nucleic acid-binding protein
MPDKVVLDSSFIAAIFFPEDEVSERAEDFASKNDLITLDLAIAEVGNVAWKRAVIFKEDKDTTLAALQDCRDFIDDSCTLVRSFDLIEEAYEISVEDKIAFYDSLFLATAEKEKAPLLTLNKKLHEKAKAKRNVRVI